MFRVAAKVSRNAEILKLQGDWRRLVAFDLPVGFHDSKDAIRLLSGVAGDDLLELTP